MKDEQRKKEIASMIISNGGYCSNKNYKTYCSVCPCRNADAWCGYSEIKADRDIRLLKCKAYLKSV